MKLLKPKIYTVALTGIRLSLLQPHILVSASGLFLQVWACGTVLTPQSLMKRRFLSLEKGASIWGMLTSDPVLPGKVTSLAELLSLYRHDSFVIAASPVYLNAVEDDLLKGMAYLTCPREQLKIASSASYNGRLRVCAIRWNPDDERP
jgi:hypothetical protein